MIHMQSTAYIKKNRRQVTTIINGNTGQYASFVAIITNRNEI